MSILSLLSDIRAAGSGTASWPSLLCGSLGNVVSRLQGIGRDLGLPGSTAGHALQAGDDAVYPIGIAGQRLGEGFEVGDDIAQRFRILRKDGIDPLQRGASRLGHALAAVGLARRAWARMRSVSLQPAPQPDCHR